jgi:hypothetical protein
MLARRSIKRALILVAFLALLITMSTAGMHQAAAAPAAGSKPRPPGKAWHHRKWHPPQVGQSPLSNGAQSPAAAAEMAAAKTARASGKAVVAGSLTTPTSLVTAEPNGTLTGSSSVLPVRVWTATGWVPVNTRLRFTAGRWAPVAVPGDSVSFSAGGTGPAVEISTGHSSVRLWWARRLPRPSVSGSSAVYKNALPGVNLVLTATSMDTGGYSAVLVVTKRTAALPGLVRLMWRVSAPGTLGLRTLRDGGLFAAANSLRGYFGAAAPAMWDSSSLRLNAAKSAIRGAEQSAFAAGAGLAGDGMGAVSSAAGPAGGARLATVTARVVASGRTLSLAPDTRLLTSSSTRFPVFIAAAGFYYHDVTANEQAYDPVQSDNGNEGCGSDTGICDTGVSCTGSHYDSSNYSFSPVGYDNFGAPPPNNNCQFNDTDYALYRVGIPGGSLGSNAVIANSSFQIKEVYTSSCSGTATMTATWIGAIGQSTGWPGPGASPGNKDATQTLGPDPNSCDQTEDTGQVVPAGFNVTSDLNAISDSATTITFRVWESGSPSDTLHKQLTDNPTLEVQWVDKPDVPKSLQESAGSDGAGNTYDCSTSSSSAPHIGKTDSLNGPYLDATYSDVNGITVQADIEYKQASASSWTVVKNANNSVASGSPYGYHLGASVTSKLANGTLMEWAAQAETGTGTIGTTPYGPYVSGYSKPCYFAVYPTSPDPPTLAPNFTATTPQTVGGPDVKFTITESSGDTASKFVWGLDQLPPTSSPPAAQICSSTATSSCTALAKNSGGRLFATLSIPVVAPGPHDVWVYEIDTGNNDSGTVNGAPKGQTSTFSGAGDPMVQYVSQSSLELNFQAAVAAGKSVMISTQAGLPGNANADGNGNSFDSAQMTAAGWDSGQTVTVDGATFTLPSFGTTADKGDNLLSASQRIGTGPSGAQGSALVFLATSTHGVVPVPGVTGTGSVDSTPLNLDYTAPMVEAGYQVTGNACSYEVLFNNTASCTAATGEINYAAGCPTATNNQQKFTLTVPDWVTGPADIAALEMPDRDHPGAQQASNPNIYVFAAPVNPSCTVMSVDLPDVGPSIYAPALHILGMTFRNTTTATPQVGGGMIASPSGQAWTGAFESDIDNADGPPSGLTWGSQTVRIALSPGVSVPAGASLRIRLSDPGFFSEDGSGAQNIGAASIALQQSGPTAQSTPIPLTFDNGSKTTAIVPEGGDIYSDPTQPLPFAIAPNQDLLVSLYLANQSIPVLPLNDNPSGATSWFTASGTNNQTGVQSGSAFTVTGSTYAATIVPLLTGVDVTTAKVTTTTPVTPGEPTVVVTGDAGIVDNNIATIPSDALDSPSQRLAGQLVSGADAPGMGVVDASTPSNAIFADTFTTSIGIPPTGIAFQERVDHDILAEPDVGTVIINEGLEDVLMQDGSTVGPVDLMTTLTNFLGSVQSQLFAFGVPAGGIVFGSLTPCWLYANAYNCDSAADTGRLQVNQTLGDLGGSCPSNFNGAVEVPGSNPNQLNNSSYGTGDDANLSLGATGGFAALAAMENLTCGVSLPQYAFPPTG